MGIAARAGVASATIDTASDATTSSAAAAIFMRRI
jgi:hypothetical protein